jgi:mono/diheme cytochrome c family protein
MQPRTLYWILLFGGLAFLGGCGRLPGQPKEEDRWKPPSEIKDFALLFDTNCRACHSNGQTLGASISMNNPPYLAVVPKEVMHKVIEEGIPGTAMPGYSAKAGGMSWPMESTTGPKVAKRPLTIFLPTAPPWVMRNTEKRFLPRIVPAATVPTGKE